MPKHVQDNSPSDQPPLQKKRQRFTHVAIRPLPGVKIIDPNGTERPLRPDEWPRRDSANDRA